MSIRFTSPARRRRPKDIGRNRNKCSVAIGERIYSRYVRQNGNAPNSAATCDYRPDDKTACIFATTRDPQLTPRSPGGRMGGYGSKTGPPKRTPTGATKVERCALVADQRPGHSPDTLGQYSHVLDDRCSHRGCRSRGPRLSQKVTSRSCPGPHPRISAGPRTFSRNLFFKINNFPVK